MNFRGAMQALFGKLKAVEKIATWKEVGNYTSVFSNVGSDLYASEVVRACIRTLAEHTSKANVRVLRGGQKGDSSLQRMIQYQPNMFMNGKDFLYKTRTLLEVNNVCFIYIQRDDTGRCIGLYPMPPAIYEAIETVKGLYIQFNFLNGNSTVHSWKDLAVLRKDYHSSDIFCESNNSIQTSLELLNVTNQGMANAIKSTSNLRGVLKSTKAMLSDEAVKKTKDDFVRDYLGFDNSSGIGSLDAYTDFIPVTLQPMLANYKSVEELRLNIYRYFGVNEDAIMSKITGDTWEAFYESKIEPVLLALGLELTNKIFTAREKGFENEIVFESNRMQYMSTSNKLALVQMVDRMALTPNEWRQIMNLAPVPWGDEPQSWQNPKGASEEESEAEDDKQG